MPAKKNSTTPRKTTQKASPANQAQKSQVKLRATPKKKTVQKKTKVEQETAALGKVSVKSKAATEITPATQDDEQKTIKLLKQLCERLSGRKAEDIVVLDLRQVSSYLDYFLIANALSHLHIKNLANETDDFMRSLGYQARNNILADVESGWQILDYGEIVVHLFTKEKRLFYHLEKTWEKAKRIV